MWSWYKEQNIYILDELKTEMSEYSYSGWSKILLFYKEQNISILDKEKFDRATRSWIFLFWWS
jgi:hypothetical protein